MSKFQLNSCSRWNCLKARGKTIYIVINTRQYMLLLFQCNPNKRRSNWNLSTTNCYYAPRQKCTNRNSDWQSKQLDSDYDIDIAIIFNLINKYPINIISATAKIIQHSLIHVSSWVNASIGSCYAPSCCSTVWLAPRNLYCTTKTNKRASGKQEETKCKI